MGNMAKKEARTLRYEQAMTPNELITAHSYPGYATRVLDGILRFHRQAVDASASLPHVLGPRRVLAAKGLRAQQI